MPKYNEGAYIYLKALWEKAVANFCVKEGFVTKAFVDKLLSWRHTGFSVYMDTRIDYKKNDEISDQKLRKIIHYIAKPPIALEHLKYNGGKVLYKGKFNKGINKNFETYEPDDFLAALTSHIPTHRQKYRNMYGIFSNRTRGYNKKNNTAIEQVFPVECPDTTPAQRKYKQSWAILLRKVHEVDPLICKKCGSRMKVIAVITEHSSLKKILKHVGLWNESFEVRGPPLHRISNKIEGAIEHIPFNDGWPEPVY